MKIYSNSKRNADHKSDKRISPTNIRYKGYMIRLDRGGDGYNVYDKYGELEDAGYPSLSSAKNLVDELVNENTDDRIQSSADIGDDTTIQEMNQEFTSKNTSINSTKLPAIFKLVSFDPGTINIDYGGGKFDNATEYLAEQGVTNLVYDPYNRSNDHNRNVIRNARQAGGADTATCSNVLNVIKEPEVRRNVLENISKIVKPGGLIYITVYEGSGNRNEGATKSGYQLNRKTEDYLDEIREVFPDATRRGKLIVATNSKSVNSSTNIKASSTGGYVYTYCDECGKKNRVKVTFNNFNEPFNDTEYKCKYCGTNNLLTDPHSYDENGNVIEASQSYLDRIEELMNQGLDEETASREAYAEFYPDEYDADDYDEIYSANYGGAYYVEVNSTRRGTAPYEKKFSDFNSAFSFAKKRGNSKTIIYIWDIPKEERSSNSVPNAVYDFDSGWQIIRPVDVNEDRSVNKTITSANYGGAYDVDDKYIDSSTDITAASKLWMGKYKSAKDNKMHKVYFEFDTSDFEEAEQEFEDIVPEPYSYACLLGTAPHEALLQKDGFEKIEASDTSYIKNSENDYDFYFEPDKNSIINAIMFGMSLSKNVANIIYNWYDSEGAFDDFDSVSDIVSFIRSDIYDMLDACTDTKEKNLVNRALKQANDMSDLDDPIENSTKLKRSAKKDIRASQSYLDRLNELMDQGLDEDTASREAYAEFYPDDYDADDYDSDDAYDKYYDSRYDSYDEYDTGMDTIYGSDTSSDGDIRTWCDNCGAVNWVNVHFPAYNKPFDDTEFRCKKCGARNKLTDPHEYNEAGEIINCYGLGKGTVNNAYNEAIAEDEIYSSTTSSSIQENASRDDLLWSVSRMLSYEDWYDDNVEFHTELHKDGSRWIYSDRPLGDNDAIRVTGYIEDILIDRYDMSSQDFEVIRNKYGSGWTILFKDSDDQMTEDVSELRYYIDDNKDEIYSSKSSKRNTFKIISSTTSSNRYWYFTRHGVQPGSVPKYVNILDIVDTPEGSYFLADGVILTNDLRNYEIKERKPEGVNSSSTIQGGLYSYPERPLDPPDYDEGEEIEFSADIQLHMDADITINADGSFDYVDNSFPWADDGDLHNGYFYCEEYDMKVKDVTGVVEDIDELIDEQLPSEPGLYHVECDVTLRYDVSNVLEYNDSDEYDTIYTYDTSDAYVELNRDKSQATNFKVEKISE